MTQPSAVNKGLTMGIVILKAIHEEKEKLAVNMHGAAHIANKDELERSGFRFLHPQFDQVPSIFEGLPKGSPEIKLIPCFPLLPSP